MIAMPAKKTSPYERPDRPGMWYGRIDDHNGRRRRVKLGENYDDAVVQLRDLQDRANLVRRGVATPEQFQVADGGQRKVAGLLSEFCDELKGARRTPGYVREIRETITRYTLAVKIRMVNQASTANIERHLSGLLARGLSTETRNKAATRLHTFFGWVVDRKHLASNPARGIKRVAGDGGQDRPRSLTQDELDRLLKTTKDPFRRMGYLLGARAGLRLGEAHRLQWENLDLAGGWIVLPKQITKMKRAAELPMHDWILRAAKSLAHRSTYVCGPNSPSRYTWLRDLERAGIVKKKDPGLKSGNWSEDDLIGYRDDRGLVLSRRCLRKTCGTHMARAGATQTEVMHFMRHRSAEMTNELYTDSRLLNLRGAVDQMDKTTKLFGDSGGSIDRQPKHKHSHKAKHGPNGGEDEKQAKAPIKLLKAQ